MMRSKALSLIVTFPSTTQAMLMEAKCKEFNTPGRMIPIPGEISAGCGLAWKAEPVYREEIEQLIKDQGIQMEGMAEILF
jgi:hypothetical protein